MHRLARCAAEFIRPALPARRCSIIGREIGFENISIDANLDTSTHGNEAFFEFIADKTPDCIFIMDRDAAIGTDGAKPAQEIMENHLLMGMDAYKNGHIVYLTHPAVWCTAEGGITALDLMEPESSDFRRYFSFKTHILLQTRKKQDFRGRQGADCMV